MKLSTGVKEFLGFVFKLQFNTEMWGREKDTHNTYHVFCINWSKTKDTNGYAITLIFLYFNVIVGYRFKDTK